MTYDVVIVGGGPRAISVVERLTARAEPGARVRAAIIDVHEVGAGSTWRTDQTGHFLNNTYAAHTTVYPDDSTPMDGPVTPGPDLVQWARSVTPQPSDPDWLAEDLRDLQPWSYPTRRLQGVYFRDQLRALAERGVVQVDEVVGQVVDLDVAGGDRIVHLADGHSLRAHTVVLAQGMVQAQREASTEAFVAAAGEHGLTYIEPGMPAERDWSALPAGEPAIIAGTGANFFDVIAELTMGRGGRFVARDGEDPFDLTYLPSGREPRLMVGSRRGLPYRSKSFYGALPTPYQPRLATPQWFAEVAATPCQDLRLDIWPQIARELTFAHLSTLLAAVPGAITPGLDFDDLLRLVGETDVGELAALVDRCTTAPQYALDVDRLDRPNIVRPSAQEWDDWVDWWVEAELGSISDPDTSPRAAVNRAFAVLRGQVGKLTARGVISPRSITADVKGWFDSLGLTLASGPPPERTARLLALVRQGLVELIGESMTVTVRGGQFVAHSDVQGREYTAAAFAETRMSRGSVDDTSEPLLRSLLDSGRARLHTLTGSDGSTSGTRSLDVTPDKYLLIGRDGAVDERVIAIGIPAGDVQPGSAIGATPGVPSPLLAGADRAAEQVLQVVSQIRDDAQVAPARA